MVVFIVLNSLLNHVAAETHLCFHLGNLLRVHCWFFCVKTKVVTFRLIQLVKWMSQTFNVNPMFGVSNKYFCKDVSCFR